uniref:Caspase-6-like n=2 Tax=Ciona intestinalis TaxID=7719 RepID=F7AVK7_CIOIN
MQEEWIDDCYDINYSGKIGIAAVFLLKKRNDATTNELENEKIEQALQQDFDDFTELFENMQLDVMKFGEKMKFSEAVANLENVSKKLKSENNYSCFICMFIGHGSDGCIKATDGKLDIHENILAKFMTHKCLEGKPKIFIFQACRGTKKNVKSDSSLSTLCDKEIKADGSDVLLCYAAWSGYVSYALTTNEYERGTQYL